MRALFTPANLPPDRFERSEHIGGGCGDALRWHACENIERDHALLIAWIDVNQIDALIRQLGELFEIVTAVDHPRVEQRRRPRTPRRCSD